MMADRDKTDSLHSSLALKLPPVPLMGLFALLMWLAALIPPTIDGFLGVRITVAIGLIIAGLAFAVVGVYAFRRASTTMNPLTPDKSSSLVTTGVYQWSRNPMYVGFGLALLGWAFYLGSPWSFLLVAGYVLYIDRFQILPEERILAQRFGSPYRQYQTTVRRWL